MKLEFSLAEQKHSNIKFHERVVPCGRTDGWTDIWRR